MSSSMSRFQFRDAGFCGKSKNKRRNSDALQMFPFPRAESEITSSPVLSIRPQRSVARVPVIKATPPIKRNKKLKRRNFYKLRAAVHHALVLDKEDTDIGLIDRLRNRVKEYSAADVCPFQCMRLRDALDEFEEQMNKESSKCEEA